MAITRIPMHKIVSRHRDTRGSLTDWFAEDAMAFFDTRLPASGLGLGSRIAFVTSEQGPSGVRAFSVRSFDWNTGEVKTVGLFNRHPDRRAATVAAIRFLVTA